MLDAPSVLYGEIRCPFKIINVAQGQVFYFREFSCQTTSLMTLLRSLGCNEENAIRAPPHLTDPCGSSGCNPKLHSPKLDLIAEIHGILAMIFHRLVEIAKFPQHGRMKITATPPKFKSRRIPSIRRLHPIFAKASRVFKE